MTEPSCDQHTSTKRTPISGNHRGARADASTSEAQRLLRVSREEAARRRRYLAEEAVSRALRKVGEAGRAAALARLQSRYLTGMRRSPAGAGGALDRDTRALQLRLARLASVRARADAYRAARAADQAIAQAQRSCRDARAGSGPSITDLVAALDRAGNTTRPFLKRAS